MDLKQILIFFEGNKNITYLDSRGLATGGCGHLMLSGDLVKYPVGAVIPDWQIGYWLQNDIIRSTFIAKQIFPNYNTLDEVRQQALISLAFNLGNRIGGFIHFIAAVEDQDWQEAAKQIQQSLWFQQVGERGPITRDAIKNGVWPPNI
jgi:lysozyme